MLDLLLFPFVGSPKTNQPVCPRLPSIPKVVSKHWRTMPMPMVCGFQNGLTHFSSFKRTGDMTLFVNPSRFSVVHHGNWHNSKNWLKIDIFNQFEHSKVHKISYRWCRDVFWEFEQKKNFEIFLLRLAWKVPIIFH